MVRKTLKGYKTNDRKSYVKNTNRYRNTIFNSVNYNVGYIFWFMDI